MAVSCTFGLALCLICLLLETDSPNFRNSFHLPHSLYETHEAHEHSFCFLFLTFLASLLHSEHLWGCGGIIAGGLRKEEEEKEEEGATYNADWLYIRLDNSTQREVREVRWERDLILTVGWSRASDPIRIPIRTARTERAVYLRDLAR